MTRTNTSRTAEAAPAARSVSRAGLNNSVALAALAVCGVGAPARAGNTAVVVSKTPSGSAWTNSGVIQGKVNGVVFNAVVNTVTNTSTGTISGGSGSGNAIRINANIGALTNSGRLSAWTALTNVSGSIGAFTNTGVIQGGRAAVVFNAPVGAVVNDKKGTLSGGGGASDYAVGVNTDVGTFTNLGAISGYAQVLKLKGSIGVLDNQGTISCVSKCVANMASIGVLTNSGVISSSAASGLDNGGAAGIPAGIGTIINSGTISGKWYGIVNPYYRSDYYGTIGGLTNTGRIAGGYNGVYNISTFGPLNNNTGGVIEGGWSGVDNVATLGDIVNQAGATIIGSSAGAPGIRNTATMGSLDNAGFIGGQEHGLENTGSITTLTNRAGGTITGGAGPYGVSNTRSIGPIANAGFIAGQQYGLYNSGSAGSLDNSAGGTITGGNGAYGIYNSSTMGAIANAGFIGAQQVGLYNLGSTGALTNSAGGVITGGNGSYGLYNAGSMGSIANYGFIGGQQFGLYNSGAAGPLDNFAGGTIAGGVYNSGTLGAVRNDGAISAGAAGTALFNSGQMGGLINTGTIAAVYNSAGRIVGGSSGVYNGGQISTLTNTGTISGAVHGVRNDGAASIASLSNFSGGAISGETGVWNGGSIGTLSNSGVISGSVNAINSSYVLTNILNSGTISGNITILSATSAPGQGFVTITGAASNAIGTLTGGTIGLGNASLTFAQNTLLMDDVHLPSGGSVVNLYNGQLSLANARTITIAGGFDNDGTIVSNGRPLVVTGQWTGSSTSSTGQVYIQASDGDASPVGLYVIAQSANRIDAATATVDGIGYSVSSVRSAPGPGGTYLLVADVAPSDFVFSQSGNIVTSGLAGTRALVQSGSGSTYLVGDNSYTGATTVTNGVLGIVGSSSSPSYTVTGGTLRIDGVATGTVAVSSGGALRGSGAFGGGTIGAGGLIAPSNLAAVVALGAAPGPAAAEAALAMQSPYGGGAAVRLSNPIGALTSNGDLTLAAGSTYRVGVAAGGQSDSLVVNGRATLQGGAVDVRAMPGVYGVKTAYTILDASGGVSGAFGQVTSDLAFLTPTLTYDANDVVLTMRRNDVAYTAVAATQNEYAVAAGLEGSFRYGLSPAGGTVIDALTSSSAPQAQAMLNAISGEGLAAAQTAAYGAIDALAGAVQTQAMGRVLAGQGAPPASGPAAQVDRWRFWTSAIGGGGAVGGVAGVGSASVNASGGGVAAGLEYEVAPQLTLGLAGAALSSSYSVADRATTGRQTGGIGALYGVGRAGPLYAIGLVSYGGFGTDSTRSLTGPPAPETETGRFSSAAWTGSLEVGYRFETAAVNVSPFVALQGTSLRNSAFAETSATGLPGALGLQARAGWGGSAPQTVGVQLDRVYALENDWTLQPMLRLGWTHDFWTRRDVTAGLVSLPGSLWTVQGASAPANAADLRLSMQAQNRHGLALTASAAVYAAPRATAWQGQLGLAYSW